jgi:hypothetical protein
VATLLQLRTRLNGEIGVVTDTDTAPWPVAVRSQAIADGYASLWRAGVWKDAKQDIVSVTDQWTYALTTIRKLDRLELLDSSSRLVDRPRGVIELDGTGTNVSQLRMIAPVSSGYTLRVRGWAPYVSVFANDAAVDDLPAEHIRIPLLKAKAIIYRISLGSYARYGERQAAPPVQNLTPDQILAIIAAAEREFESEAKQLARMRVRSGRPRSI